MQAVNEFLREADRNGWTATVRRGGHLELSHPLADQMSARSNRPPRQQPKRPRPIVLEAIVEIDGCPRTRQHGSAGPLVDQPCCFVEHSTSGFGSHSGMLKASPVGAGFSQIRTLEPSILVLTGSRHLFEQRLGLLQVGGVEALSEPAIDRREEIVGLSPPALLHPQPREAVAALSDQPWACCSCAMDKARIRWASASSPAPCSAKNSPRSRCNSAA